MNLSCHLMLAAIIVLPGTAVGAAVYKPGDLDVATRLALCWVFGYAIVALTATFLVLFGVLSRGSFVASLVAITAAGVWVAVTRHDLSDYATSLRHKIAAERVPILLGVAVIVVLCLLRWRESPLLNFSFPEPWRYWADGLEIADVGRVPAHTLQYGHLYPPAESKLALNSFNAGVRLLLGPEPLPAMAALLWVSVTGTLLALWSLARELELRITSPLLPLLALINLPVFGLFAGLRHYTAENYGIMCAILATALGVRACRQRGSFRDLVVCTTLLIAGALSHAVPVVAALSILGSYALFLALREKRYIATVGKFVLITLAVGAVTLALLNLSSGQIGFQGAAGPNEYSRFGSHFDPTKYFASGQIDRGQNVTAPNAGSGWFESPAPMLSAFYDKLGTSSSAFLRVLGAVLLLLGAGSLMVWGPAHLRPIAPIAVGLLLFIICFSLGFSYRYQTLVPALLGQRRLFDYIPLAPVLVLSGLAEWAVLAVASFRRLQVGMIVLLVAGATVIFVVQELTSTGNLQAALADGRSSARIVNVIRDVVPCDARILVTRRTAGTFQATTGRESITEGMAPYLRPAMLHDVVGLLLDARKFFAHPLTHEDFLARESVDYIAVISGGTEGPLRGGVLASQSRQIGPVKPQKLESVPFLTFVTRTPQLTLYEVTATSNKRSPRPLDAAGYDCVRSPLST